MHSFPKPTSRGSAFTLIELLIVVAIIAVLAAIAVPNLLESQTRSKVARVKAELRTITLAVEAYRADQSAYPKQGPPRTCNVVNYCVSELTTPVAYLTSCLNDPFNMRPISGSPYTYGICNGDAPYFYVWSYGPDLKNNFGEKIYDPTNGTISVGDIKRTTASPVMMLSAKE